MALSTKELKETRPTAEDYRRAAAIIARDPLYLDRENARLFAADPANRSAEFQQYQHKIASGTASERDEVLASAYAALARANEAERLAPELAAAAERQRLIEGFTEADGTMVERVSEAQDAAIEDSEETAPASQPPQDGNVIIPGRATTATVPTPKTRKTARRKSK